jgi:hypothetical protein
MMALAGHDKVAKLHLLRERVFAFNRVFLLPS